MNNITSQLNSISASMVITLTLKVFGCFFLRPKIDIVSLNFLRTEIKQWPFLRTKEHVLLT